MQRGDPAEAGFLGSESRRDQGLRDDADENPVHSLFHRLWFGVIEDESCKLFSILDNHARRQRAMIVQPKTNRFVQTTKPEGSFLIRIHVISPERGLAQTLGIPGLGDGGSSEAGM